MGFGTLRLLRLMIETGEIDDLRMIACTAFVRQEDEDKARAAGMDDFCTKPINIVGVKKKLMISGYLRTIIYKESSYNLTLSNFCISNNILLSQSAFDAGIS